MHTVKEMSELSGVTVKTLHHYHKIGLLLPADQTEAGYRLYGEKEAERLQQILFYRELDFPLAQIKQLMDGNPEPLAILGEQRELIASKIERWENMLMTLTGTISAIQKGEPMEAKDRFKGFQSEEQWREALQGQKDYLQEKYEYELAAEPNLDVQGLNELAEEAAVFTDIMANFLAQGVGCGDAVVQDRLQEHVSFLNAHGHQLTPASFVDQTSFFRNDVYHRQILESRQIGLAYYLHAAAETWRDAQA